MKITFPNVRWLRTNHGVMHTKKTHDASTTPANDRFPILERRYQAHNPAAGRNASREVPFRAMTPQSTPNTTHGPQPSRSSIVSASQKTVVSSRADRLVSHTARVHQNITLGSNAHAHADPTATFSENMRFAIRKIGMQVTAENTLFSTNSTNAEAFE